MQIQEPKHRSLVSDLFVTKLQNIELNYLNINTLNVTPVSETRSDVFCYGVVSLFDLDTAMSL